MFCSRKRNVETRKERRKLGNLMFLRHNIKDSGYNSTKITKQLSPTQNTPALQARPLMNSVLLVLTAGHTQKAPVEL